MAASLGMSDLLGLFIGLYLVAGGVALLREPDLYRQIMVVLRENSAVGFLTGLIAFLIGAVIISVHARWDTVMAFIVSLFGWIALLEGLALIAARPEFLDFAGRLMLKGSALRIAAVAAVVIGALLFVVALL